MASAGPSYTNSCQTNMTINAATAFPTNDRTGLFRSLFGVVDDGELTGGTCGPKGIRGTSRIRGGLTGAVGVIVAAVSTNLAGIDSSRIRRADRRVLSARFRSRAATLAVARDRTAPIRSTRNVRSISLFSQYARMNSRPSLAREYDLGVIVRWLRYPCSLE